MAWDSDVEPATPFLQRASVSEKEALREAEGRRRVIDAREDPGFADGEDELADGAGAAWLSLVPWMDEVRTSRCSKLLTAPC